ncbi:hypothetical protein GP486_000704 [Trichoglossum hirsutum]|uniref:Very-long-chain 3-oxoacyl-CoA reductase n=1 Tax=Trichoglossum hirsutum TaxID=265104 RepID=A0A9P8LI94_9PEZI|nr:hypothetical protein GP486_000704 [Trichoglossum hirsutum]
MPVEIPTPIVLSLAVIGLIYISAKILSYLRKFGPKGSWAVITGASDGIGKEFALQLASKGFNVVLVSRTQSKLEALAKDIESRHAGIRSKILAMDFAKDSDEDYGRLTALVDGLDVAILVNNVGKSHDIPVPFLHTSIQEMSDIITINCVGTLKVTQIIAPGMVQHRRGLILTMGSFGGLLPSPLLATYSGSKAFLQQWSTALGSELKPHGIQVELILSYLVTSSMSKIRRPSMLIPSPKNFVRVALGKIGRSGGAQGIAYTSTPYWSHGIFHWALATFVGLSNAFVVDRNKVMHESIRRRALRKQEREGKKHL